MKFSIAFFALILLLALAGCKKSRWNPKCWKGKEKAIIVNFPNFPAPCPPHIILENTGEVYSFVNEVPERFKPETGDTIKVKVAFHFVEGRATHHGCTFDGFVEIDCIQKR